MEANTTRPTIITNNNTFSIANDQKGVIHQTSDSSRAADATKENNLSITTTQALFGREYIGLNEVILRILFSCSLKSMLTLREVSRVFHNFASTISSLFTSYPCSPLMHKAFVSFQYAQLYDKPDLPLEEKFNFVKRENTEVHIKINVRELLNEPQILQSIEEHQLKIILKIKSVNAIIQLQNWLSSPVKPKFIDKIKELDFKEIVVKDYTDGPINRLLTIVAQNLRFLPNLTTFSLGDIEKNTEFILSSTQPFDSITKLTIGKIDCHSYFTLTDAFVNITNLSIENIYEGVVLYLPNSLKSLSIKNICGNVTFNLPNYLGNLDFLEIGNIHENATFKLPDEMNDLKEINFTIGSIHKNGTFDLPDDFKGFKGFIVGTIFKDVTSNISKSLNSIGRAYRALGGNENILKGLQYHEEALKMRKALFPGNNSDVADELTNLGIAYGTLGGNENILKSLQYFEEALKMLKFLFPGNHPDIAKSLHNLGVAYKALGGNENILKSLQYFEEALKMKKALFPGNDLGVANSLYNLGATYQTLGEAENIFKSFQYFEEALKMRKAVLFPIKHSVVANLFLYNFKAATYQALGGI